MRADELRTRLTDALTRLIHSADELRDLDQRLGDGDLGITVSSGSEAVISALAALEADAVPVDVMRAAAKAFANANPSTMAALVAGALLAGSRAWADVDDIALENARAFTAAAAENIALRGKTQLGDKTIYDGLAAVADALALAPDSSSAETAAVAAASDAVERTAPMQSRRGRASWLQQRSVGIPDPGATALLRFLEAWRASS